MVINDPRVMAEISKTNPSSMQLKQAPVAIVVAGHQGNE